MQLVSIQVGKPKQLPMSEQTRRTAIDKTPVLLPAVVTAAGIEGDGQANRKHHGGPDQAVYLYSAEDYAFWSQELGRPLAPGFFGENLTVSSFAGRELYIGDRFHVGDSVVLEVTAPRVPCATLALRVGEPTFAKRFADAGRPGVYTRVLHPGTLRAGDAIELVPGAQAVSVLQVFRLFYDKAAPAAELARALQAPLAERFRARFTERLSS